MALRARMPEELLVFRDICHKIAEAVRKYYCNELIIQACLVPWRIYRKAMAGYRDTPLCITVYYVCQARCRRIARAVWHRGAEMHALLHSTPLSCSFLKVTRPYDGTVSLPLLICLVDPSSRYYRSLLLGTIPRLVSFQSWGPLHIRLPHEGMRHRLRAGAYIPSSQLVTSDRAIQIKATDNEFTIKTDGLDGGAAPRKPSSSLLRGTTCRSG